MTTTLQEIEKCELLLKEIEEKWEWLEAGQTNTQPTDNDLFNWAQSRRGKYTIPQQFNPNQGYLKIGLIDFEQMRKDYWEYYSDRA